MATMKENIERFREALADADYPGDAESSLVSVGFAACTVGPALIEYYEASEAMINASLSAGMGSPEYARLDAARKALNEG